MIGGLDLVDGKEALVGRCLRWDDAGKKWVELAPMLQPRQAFGCCVTDEFIYLAGGITTGNCDLLQLR